MMLTLFKSCKIVALVSGLTFALSIVMPAFAFNCMNHLGLDGSDDCRVACLLTLDNPSNPFSFAYCL